MIDFVSTFPPTMCGIAAYTNHLVRAMPRRSWRVLSFRDELTPSDRLIGLDDQISYDIDLSRPGIPEYLRDRLLWFQHAFGMWGRDSSVFVQLVQEAKRKNKVIVTFHTIHFESDRTKSGMHEEEEALLDDVLPLVDAATVFSNGAYRAVTQTYPEYRNKVVVLRHGVPLYPRTSQGEARKKLFHYLANVTGPSSSEKNEITGAYRELQGKKTILLGSFGFITYDKSPAQLYELGQLLQQRLDGHRVVAIYAGRIRKGKDKKLREYLPVSEELKLIHDGDSCLFFEDYLPNEIFPLAFRALDFSVFWCHDATQSGRMANALGIGACTVGRRIEGIGETLDLAALPSATSLDDLAEKILELILEENKKAEICASALSYAHRFSFEEQARRHLLLARAVKSGMEPNCLQNRPDWDGVRAS